MGRRGPNGQFLPLGDDWIPEARARIARGETARSVAARFGFSEALVSKRCAGAQKRYLAERNGRICELSRQGLPQRAIADAVGCGQSTVGRVLEADRRAWLRREMSELRKIAAGRQTVPRFEDVASWAWE